MDYRKSAEEWMQYMLLAEERGRLILGKVSELARGELAVLRFLLQGNDGAGAKELSQRFQVNTSRTAAVLNSLEKKGYIRRVPFADDRRMIQVFITEEGRAYARGKQEEFLTHGAAMLEKLGEADTRHYIHIMKRLSEIWAGEAGED